MLNGIAMLAWILGVSVAFGGGLVLGILLESRNLRWIDEHSRITRRK